MVLHPVWKTIPALVGWRTMGPADAFLAAKSPGRPLSASAPASAPSSTARQPSFAPRPPYDAPPRAAGVFRQQAPVSGDTPRAALPTGRAAATFPPSRPDPGRHRHHQHDQALQGQACPALGHSRRAASGPAARSTPGSPRWSSLLEAAWRMRSPATGPAVLAQQSRSHVNSGTTPGRPARRTLRVSNLAPISAGSAQRGAPRTSPPLHWR